jgi:hypothetical protein
MIFIHTTSVKKITKSGVANKQIQFLSCVLKVKTQVLNSSNNFNSLAYIQIVIL